MTAFQHDLRYLEKKYQALKIQLCWTQYHESVYLWKDRPRKLGLRGLYLVSYKIETEKLSKPNVTKTPIIGVRCFCLIEARVHHYFISFYRATDRLFGCGFTMIPLFNPANFDILSSTGPYAFKGFESLWASEVLLSVPNITYYQSTRQT